MEQILLVILMFVTIAMIVVVLLQKSEGGALGMGGGGGGGGGMGGFMTGRGTANLLTRTTAILAAIFMGLALALAVLRSNTEAPRSILDQPVPGPVVPAVPEGPATPAVPLSE